MNVLRRLEMAHGSVNHERKETVAPMVTFSQEINCEDKNMPTGVLIKTEVTSNDCEVTSQSIGLEINHSLRSSEDETMNATSQNANVGHGKCTSSFFDASDNELCSRVQHKLNATKMEREVEEGRKIISRLRAMSNSEENMENFLGKQIIKEENGEVPHANITWNIVPVKKVEQNSELRPEETMIQPVVPEWNSCQEEASFSSQGETASGSTSNTTNIETVLIKEEEDDEFLSELAAAEDIDFVESTQPTTIGQEELMVYPMNTIFVEGTSVFISSAHEEVSDEKVIETGDVIERDFEIMPNYISLYNIKNNGNVVKVKPVKPDVRKVEFCPHCPAKFTRKHSLTYHLRIHSGEKPFPCDICSSRFRNKDNLRLHYQRIHTDNKPYVCTFCDSRFFRADMLKFHVRTHTGEKPYMCEYCSKKFTRKDKLKNHLLLHLPEKAVQIFSCPLCPAKFRRKDKLHSHLKIHTDDRPFTCTVCLHKFRRNDALIVHMRGHSGAMPFACTQCSSKFRQSISLKSHLRTHGVGALMTCEHCLGKFRRKKEISYHLKTSECSLEFRQTGILKDIEKPYSCQHCSAKFRIKDELKEHVVQHGKNELFYCGHCPANFPKKDTLTKHLRVHSEDGPYACSFCSAKFHRMNEKTRHLRVHDK